MLAENPDGTSSNEDCVAAETEPKNRSSRRKEALNSLPKRLEPPHIGCYGLRRRLNRKFSGVWLLELGVWLTMRPRLGDALTPRRRLPMLDQLFDAFLAFLKRNGLRDNYILARVPVMPLRPGGGLDPRALRGTGLDRPLCCSFGRVTRRVAAWAKRVDLYSRRAVVCIRAAPRFD